MQEINEALAAGEPLRRIAARHALTPAILRAHVKFHVMRPEAGESPAFKSLADTKVRIERTLQLIDDGKADDATVKQHASFLRELRTVTEKMGAMRGEIQSKTVSSLLARAGLKSERELMDLVEERKDLMTVTVDDLFNDCIRGLKDCFAMRPGWVAKARAELFPDEEAG